MRAVLSRSSLAVMLMLFTGAAILGCSGAGESAPTSASAGTAAQSAAPADAGRTANANSDLGATGDAQTAGELPSTQTGRVLIRTGEIDLTVRSVPETFDAVTALALRSGGYVSSSSSGGSKITAEPSKGATATPTNLAYLTIRVPSERFADVITQLKGMAVDSRTSTALQDVTEQVSDLEATLRNLRAVESQYVTLLGQARNVAEVLQVQERINQVRLQIDRTEARRQTLASQAEMSTLTVTLRPDAATAKSSSPLDRAAEAWQASLTSIEAVGTAVLVVVVYSWWLIPFAGLGFVLLRRFLRRTTPDPRPTV